MLPSRCAPRPWTRIGGGVVRTPVHVRPRCPRRGGHRRRSGQVLAVGSRHTGRRISHPDSGHYSSRGHGVLVQRLVRAKAAGVAFTADPLTGERGETIVSAVPGGGERLVAGQANADEWVVRDTRATCRAAPHAILDPSEAVGVAELA